MSKRKDVANKFAPIFFFVKEKSQQSGVCGECYSLHKADKNPPHLFSTKSVMKNFLGKELPQPYFFSMKMASFTLAISAN